MQYLIFKALHVIFIVSWFAGLFFMGRLFIYHRDALDKSKEEQDILIPLFSSAERRVLYIIIMPSMLITVALGLRLMMASGAYREGWFHFKMLFVFLFIGYNHYCSRIRKQLLNKTIRLSSLKLRLLNEVPFLFLIAIVFTVFLKSFFSALWAATVVISIAALLIIISLLIRKKKLK
jgi:protoporphyrinogen IX oxidase